MTEGIALPKSDNLYWWPMWVIKDYSEKNNKYIKTRKSKLNTKVLEVRQKCRVSNYIHILYDSIFVRIEPLNKYSKGVKKKFGYQSTNCIFKVELM